MNSANYALLLNSYLKIGCSLPPPDVLSCGSIPEQLILSTDDECGCARILEVEVNHDDAGPFSGNYTHLA